ncbi:MAG: hypothetical protein EA344_03395 [Alkalicoccus sp.]|nr:MAG: hypothetical protein EA344_03395 [Alkalicoccus sp.]
MKEDFVNEPRLNSLPRAEKEEYDKLTQQITDEKKKLEVDFPGEPEDRLAIEHQIELLEEKRQRILL